MLEDLFISDEVRDKLLNKHQIITSEVEDVWASYDGTTLEDTREAHLTNPPSEWFLAKGSSGRILKVIFVIEDGIAYLKSAYELTRNKTKVIQIFRRNGGII